MVRPNRPSRSEKEAPTGARHSKDEHTAEKGGPTPGDSPVEGDPQPAPSDNVGLVDRRSLLTAAGATAVAGLAGAAAGVDPAQAAIDVASGGEYEVWTISGQEVYDLSDGEDLSGVLVDQTAEGACLTIRSRNKSGWSVKNVGFLGVGQAGDGGNRFQLQVSTPAGATGLIENVWANGKARDGQAASQLGGVYVRSSHAGHIDIRHTYFEGFGNNAVYASAVGKDSGADGSVTIENSYHRDNTASQFRIGSPDSVVRNSVGVIDDPSGDRGAYPGTSSNQNARGIWGKHYRNQRFENCSFYVSPEDVQPDGAFEARYIDGRSHGDEAVATVVDCQVNADAPTLTGSTSNARVDFTNLGEQPTVSVLSDGGVPQSPKMAARGERSMPTELPGADGGSTSNLDRTLTVDGSGAARTDYSFSVSGDLAANDEVGSLGSGDTIDGSTATGFVDGGVDGYRFSGEITDATVDGNAAILVDGTEVDPATLGDTEPAVSTGAVSAVSDSIATLSGSLESLGTASSAEVAFEWRESAANSWTRSPAQSRTSAGSFSADLTGFAPGTRYDYRAVVAASDGDTATGTVASFTTDVESTLGRTLTVDGSGTARTDYSFSVSGGLSENEAVGSLGTGDAIDGSTATGFVNGGTDGYRFSGEITDATVDGNAAILVDGTEVDPATLGDTEPAVSTGAVSAVSESAATLSGSLDSLGKASSAAVAFEWRPTGTAAWSRTEPVSRTNAGSFSQSLADLSANTNYEYRAVVVASDGDTATGTVAGFTTDAAPQLDRTLAVDGSNADWTEYTFTVSGEIANNEGVGSFDTDDTIEGQTVTGFVNGGVDGYRFSGEVTAAEVNGDATVIVDGEAVDQTSLGLPPRTLTIDGSGAGRTDYELAVSGDLAANDEVGSLGSGDAIDGRTATGFVDGGVDGYRFSGEIVGFQIDGDAAVIVDGQEVNANSLVLPNHLVFDANGSQGETTYDVQVSGDLVNDPLLGGLESDDGLSGSSVAGTVAEADRDGFRFSGDLVGLRLDGEASVRFEDTDD